MSNNVYSLIINEKEQLQWSTTIHPALFHEQQRKRFAKKLGFILVLFGLVSSLVIFISSLFSYPEEWSIGLLVNGSNTAWSLVSALFFLMACISRGVTWSDSISIPSAPTNVPATPLTRSVESYLDPSTWAVIKLAYELAVRQHSVAIEPIHLFAASTTSSSGSALLMRLGMTFDQLKPAIAELFGILDHAEHIDPILSDKAKDVLLQSFLIARDQQRPLIMPLDVFQASYRIDQRIADTLDVHGLPQDRLTPVADWIRLQEQLIEDHHHFIKLAQLKPDASMNRAMTAHSTPLLDQFGEDLTRAARHGALFPLIGRDEELEQLIRQFEGGNNSVILLSEPGVGKRALIEGLAQRMVIEEVPVTLFDKRMVVVDVAHVLAGGDPSYAPQRLMELIREAESSGNILLVLQQLDAIAKVSANGIGLADLLASDLEQGRIQLLATSTPSAWTEIIEPLTLGSRFSKLLLQEPEQEKAMMLLMAKSGSIEYRAKSYFTYGALQQAYSAAKRYLKDTRLPESALQLMTDAATLVSKKSGSTHLITEDDIAQAVHAKTNIPVESIHSDEKQKLLHLESALKERVIGQSEAVTAVAQAMRRARVDVRETRKPMATFLFLGPTGVGKTELAKALASEYIGSETMMVRLDMSEYQLASSANRLIGQPGDPKGGLLTEAIRKRPFSIILLDELEKAHPDVLTLFLQVLDDGRLTDGVGRTIDFTNTIVIATSNAGAGFIQQSVREQKPYEQLKRELIERELQSVYRPEFLNRFDGVIVFSPLTIDEVEQITWLQMKRLSKQLSEKGITFQADDTGVRWLAEQGYDPQFGVRPLKRLIQDKVETAIADLLLKDSVARKDTLILEDGGHLRIQKWQG